MDRDPTLPNEADLAEMRDDGRLSEAAMWAEIHRLGESFIHNEPVPEPSISHEEGSEAAAHLLDAERAVIGMGAAIKLAGNADLHLRINVLLNELSRLGGDLADRWGNE